MKKINKKELGIKEKKLDELSVYLKNEFIGLDEQIDKIIDNIKIWYLLPEIVDRPIIVNLWGMTGTGKTDLVRKLVKFLNFDNNFVELQMGTNVSVGEYDTKASNVRELLIASDLKEKEPAVILFDEFQRFRKLNQQGEEKDDKSFDDIWMLLSDGKFSNQIKGSKSFIDDKREDCRYYLDRYNKAKKNDKPDILISRFYKSLYAMISKKIDWKGEIKTYKDAYDMLSSIKEGTNIFSGEDYSKCLIFVCGNLDNAYQMAHDVGDADTDADILHNYSKKINIVNIKNCLTKLFKPEQIARLGNNHVIYPSLSKKNYTKLIKRYIKKIIKESSKKTGVKIKYNKDLIQLIYNNFVFPSQGTRPVFSGINSLISTIIPATVFKYIKGDMKGGCNVTVRLGKIYVEYDNEEELHIPYQFELDKIRSKISNDKTRLFAVHETGHALVYALLVNYAPKQILVNTTSFDGAYVLPNETLETKTILESSIMVLLAGTIAEELVFGMENISTGCFSDLQRATVKLTKFHRKYGFGKAKHQQHTTMAVDESGSYLLNDSDTDNLIRQHMEVLKDKTKKLLEENWELFLKITDYVFLKKGIDGQEFVDEFGGYFDDIKYIDSLQKDQDDEIITNYEELYDEIRNKHLT